MYNLTEGSCIWSYVFTHISPDDLFNTEQEELTDSLLCGSLQGQLLIHGVKGVAVRRTDGGIVIFCTNQWWMVRLDRLQAESRIGLRC